jgi:hypothetical protein
MNLTKETWERVDRGDFWEIICPHPSGVGRQSLGYFRKADLTPIVNLIWAIPEIYESLTFILDNFNADSAEGFMKAMNAGIFMAQQARAKAEGREYNGEHHHNN